MNNKYGKLEPHANWLTFSLEKHMILNVYCLTNTHNTCDYK